MITLSKLHLAAVCPGSATLPTLDYTVPGQGLGKAIHEWIQWEVDADATHSVEDLASQRSLGDDDAGRLAFIAEHLRLPVPRGAFAETSLAIFPDGSVCRVEGGAGHYPEVGQVVSGQLDLVWSEPTALTLPVDEHGHLTLEQGIMVPRGSALWIADVKTGDEENVPPIDRNWQLRGGALLAARWTGATKVIPAIVYVNAAECAQAVRKGRVYEGRWEVGATLDAAALDAIEQELWALPAVKAKLVELGGRDGSTISRGPSNSGLGWHARGPDEQTEQQARAKSGDSDRQTFTIGPHCTHCAARGACHALATQALMLLGADAPTVAQGVTIAPESAAHLAGIVPVLRSMADSIETAVRAHASANNGRIQLADGREYGPHLETVTSYRTTETFEALADVVGEEKANEAFEATAASVKRALAGQPRGAWPRLRKDLEARGAVVETGREVWRTKWPAKAEREAHSVVHPDVVFDADVQNGPPGERRG